MTWRPNWPIWLCLFFWILVVFGCNRSMFYRESADEFTAWALSMKKPSKYGTMMNINDWMQQHMRYEADGLIDNFKPHLQTWNQSGDCEDWAVVALEALNVCGFDDFYLVSVFYDDSGHTVCTDGVYHIGNWGLLGPYGNMDSVIKSISPNWKKYTIRNRNMDVIKSEVR